MGRGTTVDDGRND